MIGSRDVSTRLAACIRREPSQGCPPVASFGSVEPVLALIATCFALECSEGDSWRSQIDVERTTRLNSDKNERPDQTYTSSRRTSSKTDRTLKANSRSLTGVTHLDANEISVVTRHIKDIGAFPRVILRRKLPSSGRVPLLSLIAGVCF